MHQDFNPAGERELRFAGGERSGPSHSCTESDRFSCGRLPAIGVLVFEKSPIAYLPPLRARALAAEAALQGTRLFLFCADDCNFDDETIQATTWIGGEWRKIRIEVPGVILIVTRPIRPRQIAVEQWIKAHATVVEDRGLNKLALAEFLSNTRLRGHVIPYRVLTADELIEGLEHWLVSRGDSVVKPADGKRGSGIYMLHRDDTGRWRVRKDDDLVFFDRARDAAAYVGRRIAGRMRYRSFLVQDYIKSTSRDGRAADFRLHVQRDGSGQWTLTRAYVRLGEAGRAVSNVSRGGFQGPAESHLVGRQRPATLLQEDMETLALSLAETIDTACERPLSELGIDLSIDERDTFWIIEANARPQTSLHEHERAVRTIAYALHLYDAQNSQAEQIPQPAYAG